jgi:hypothetical protein
MSQVQDLEFSAAYWKLQIGTKVDRIEHYIFPEYYNLPQPHYLYQEECPSCYCTCVTEGDTNPSTNRTICQLRFQQGYADFLDLIYFGPEQSFVNPGVSLRYDASYKGQRQAQSDYSRGLTATHPIHIAEPVEAAPDIEKLIPRVITVYPNSNPVRQEFDI